MSLVTCKDCKSQMSTKAKACPQCGAPAQKHIGLGGLLFLVIIGVVIYTFNSEPTPRADAAPIDPRQARIENQFSLISGAHRNLERTIKAAMNDPDSYDHVDTGYADDGESLRVQTTYRGTNAFGGVVTNRVTAKVSLDGEILEIIEE